MRCFLILVLLTGFCLDAPAQSWQAGVQQGISYWLTRKAWGTDRLRTVEGSHLTWDKEIALKYQSKKKLGFELGLGYYHFRQQTPGATEDTILSINGDSYGLSLRMAVLYDVTYPLLGFVFPQMASMKSYIAFTCTPSLLWDDAAVALPDENESYQLCRTRFSVWVGFSYLHEVPLGKRLMLVNQFSFSGRPFVKYREEDYVLPIPNKRVAVQSGLRLKL